MRSSKQGGEVSTESGGDRVIANRESEFANKDNPVATALGTDFIPTEISHLPGLKIGKKLLKARGIGTLGFAARQGLFGNRNCFRLLAHID